MKISFVVLVAGALCVVGIPALADDPSLISEMNMKPLTAAQSAQLRAERDTAKAKWAAMSPSEKAAVTQSMKNKRVADMTAIEKFAQNDDMTAMTKSETAQMKAEREAAQAKWAAMTPEEKAAVRKATREKREADLNAMERTSQNDDMGRYFSY
jgi:predicted Fe-S protein YdhL (DUF1289 family)